MNFSYFVPVTHAAETIHANDDQTSAHTNSDMHTETGTTHQASSHDQGFALQPTTIALQAFNFIVLLVVLHFILYKPLSKLLKEREQKIKEGVKNAEKAETALQEANLVRRDVVKQAHVESQQMLEEARKSGEDLKSSIVQKAHDDAKNIVKSGHELIEIEKAKSMQEMKIKAVKTIVKATEKILKEKLDPAKDARLIEESFQYYS